MFQTCWWRQTWNDNTIYCINEQPSGWASHLRFPFMSTVPWENCVLVIAAFLGHLFLYLFNGFKTKQRTFIILFNSYTICKTRKEPCHTQITKVKPACPPRLQIYWQINLWSEWEDIQADLGILCLHIALWAFLDILPDEAFFSFCF